MSTQHSLTDAHSHLLCPRVKPERRKERRYPTQDPVEVNLLSPDNGTLPATVIDVSRSGMRIECARPIPQLTKIEIVFPATGLVAFGEVRYSRQAMYLFHAGVFVEDVIATGDYAEPHLAADEVARFVQGTELTTYQVFRIERHRLKCCDCERVIVAAAQAVPMPVVKPAG
jgi:PilZ domain